MMCYVRREKTVAVVEEMFSLVTQTKWNAYADDHQIYHYDVDPLVLDRYICNDVDKANQWYS